MNKGHSYKFLIQLFDILQEYDHKVFEFADREKDEKLVGIEQ